MSRALLLSLFITAAPLAHAGTVAALSADGAAAAKCDDHAIETTTRYDQLSQYYNSPGATTPTVAEIDGWHTGRCYLQSSPTTARNSILTLTERAPGGDQDDGPLFPPGAVEQVAMPIYNSGAGESYYDVMNDAKAIETQQAIAASLNHVTAFGPYDDNSQGSTSDRGNLQYRLKKNGGYIVGRMTLIRRLNGQAAGEAYAYCYWFNRVR
jgi:hypothetical protein